MGRGRRGRGSLRLSLALAGLRDRCCCQSESRASAPEQVPPACCACAEPSVPPSEAGNQDGRQSPAQHRHDTVLPAAWFQARGTTGTLSLKILFMSVSISDSTSAHSFMNKVQQPVITNGCRQGHGQTDRQAEPWAWTDTQTHAPCMGEGVSSGPREPR